MDASSPPPLTPAPDMAEPRCRRVSRHAGLGRGPRGPLARGRHGARRVASMFPARRRRRRRLGGRGPREAARDWDSTYVCMPCHHPILHVSCMPRRSRSRQSCSNSGSASDDRPRDLSKRLFAARYDGCLGHALPFDSARAPGPRVHGPRPRPTMAALVFPSASSLPAPPSLPPVPDMVSCVAFFPASLLFPPLSLPTKTIRHLAPPPCPMSTYARSACRLDRRLGFGRCTAKGSQRPRKGDAAAQWAEAAPRLVVAVVVVGLSAGHGHLRTVASSRRRLVHGGGYGDCIVGFDGRRDWTMCRACCAHVAPAAGSASAGSPETLFRHPAVRARC